jgi:ABC-type antimicrobial peptide transport system permease subunit
MKGNPEIARRSLQKELERLIPGGMRFQLFASWEEMDRILYSYRVLAAITGFLGLMAFLLTTSGVFGMLSWAVTQRRKEFGIRVALGAGRSCVTGMVLRKSLGLAAAGSVLGALAALAVARVLSNSIYRFDLFDVGGYATGVLLVIAAAMLGSWIPVRRAANVDPARTLQCD